MPRGRGRGGSRGRGGARGRGRGRRDESEKREEQETSPQSVPCGVDAPTGPSDLHVASAAVDDEEDGDLEEAIRRSLLDKTAEQSEEDDFQRAIRQSMQDCPDVVDLCSSNSYVDDPHSSDEGAKSNDDDDYQPPKAPEKCSRRRGGSARGRGGAASGAPSSQGEREARGDENLGSKEVNKRMKTMFDSSLKLHATGQYMQACRAICTLLYPHQMYALAWMANRENTKGVGVQGGILADDMGLGKTLSILALILTNFHDKRPMSKPKPSFTRRLEKAVARYLPQRILRETNVMTLKQDKESSRNNKPKSTRLNLEKLFGNSQDLCSSDEEKDARGDPKRKKRRKDLKQPVKSSQKRSALTILTGGKGFNRKKEEDNEVEDDDPLSGTDEFDTMIEESQGTLSSRLGLEDDSQLLQKEEFHFHDGLSDDEEFQSMTDKERYERFRPKLNLDGATEFSGDEARSSKDEKSSLSEGTLSQSWNELPDINEIGEPSKKVDLFGITRKSIPELTQSQKKNMIIPPREPAFKGTRRGATLIVTPASLLSHWLVQIEEHVDKRVDLKVFVHYAQTKALLGGELEDQDIVLTTYGTLSAEFASQQHSPLLKARWLRVCLDEGHGIKNHRARTAQAAANLNTQRKWIISGTPIQNNLGELWSLLNWLNFEPYAQNRNLFRQQIEMPVKHGAPYGLKRLQTVVQAICLRRTKDDEVNGKPIVKLPNKTINVRYLDFTTEERAVYDTYMTQGRNIILKFIDKGTLLANYAHVLVVMMRLRQLCCHRELLPGDWKNLNMDEVLEMAAALAAEAEAAARQEATAAAAARGGSPQGEDEARHLAEHLRQLIRDGLSDECSICLCEFTQPVITPCAHVFCRHCISHYIESSHPPPARCPLCRRGVAQKELLEAAPEDEEEDEENKSSSDPFEDIVMDVSSSKLNAALKELVGIRRDFPGEKTIVVSQFTSLLSMMQPLLNDEGFKYTRLDGTMSSRSRSDVVAEFQDNSSDSPSVMLLSLRAGGVGLNLTAASRLILLDPAWTPSTENQCFDRIHRLGQGKDVTITKFIMKESIEERMLTIQEKKKDLIAGAFRQSAEQQRSQRIRDIMEIFGI